MYVLDTSALLTVFYEEDGAPRVLEILEPPESRPDAENERPRVYLPFMTLMEFEYLASRRFGASVVDQALRMVGAWPVERVDSSPEWGSYAARVKAGAGLSVADAWNAALALMLDAELVHKDPEFDRVEGLRHLRLPYKDKKR
ncbi:MAG TPA: PIN domain-containing protein [Thermoanaerobaculia bacterium]|nr:PIN domain-containing protein [Thermoanaerobaculia bacterium]